MSLKADKTGIPYSKVNFARFILEVVQGGDDNQDVLNTQCRAAKEKLSLAPEAGKDSGESVI